MTATTHYNPTYEVRQASFLRCYYQSLEALQSPIALNYIERGMTGRMAQLTQYIRVPGTDEHVDTIAGPFAQ